MGSTGTSHPLLASDARRLLRLRAQKRASVPRKLHRVIADDQLLLRCMYAVCPILFDTRGVRLVYSSI